MGFLANTSCGKWYIEWRALKELNARGIFTPEQISNTCDKNWEAINPDGSVVINKDQCQQGVMDAVNYLGSIGDGLVFNEEEYNNAYKTFDMIGLGKITKIQFNGIISKMVVKDE